MISSTATLLCRTALFLTAASAAWATSIPRKAESSACKLPANESVYYSSGFGYNYDCAPSTGALNALMLFIDFPDQTASEASAKEAYDFFLPKAQEWFDKSSYGKLYLNITTDTTQFFRMPRRAADYQFERGLTHELHQSYVQDALGSWLKATNAPVPAANSTGGPLVDVLYIVPTRNATAITFSVALTSPIYTTNSNYIARKTVTLGVDSYNWWGYKVLNHETGHAFCLPDLYPLPSGYAGLYTGNWDIMAKVDGYSPNYFAWNKWRLGWLSDDQVECVVPSPKTCGRNSTTSTIHKLAPLETVGGVKAVVVKQSEKAALVAEVRSKSGTDDNACGTGVLLYTVATDVTTGQGPIRVLDGNPGWGSASCANDELDNAPLSLNGGGASSYTVKEWGVTVTVVEQKGDDYTIRIDVL
ncbi:uncharacterized protein CTRU02_208264 [Colletotrichum truncatum]|uniref:Secreted protein n=1 Tax=Colletotrichum truncatum TaxID=5467 RepID=A0ACC3YVU5_COLTU|nr:uncharacterized protein CTRU02_07557 [Colletotrichum truncatum]KAF6791217.1 secreted protein [Colletotrichum truncatum]